MVVKKMVVSEEQSNFPASSSSDTAINRTESYDVLVLDSGVGGLSIMREIRRMLPHASLFFVGDTEALPYGLKDEVWLERRLAKLISQILRQFDIKVVVIACNTASTLALEYLRKRFDLPIVGVVPAIKPAAQISKDRRIGLLATPATISREYTKRLIDTFASDCEVVSIGSSRLVELSEAHVRGDVVCNEELSQILSNFGHKKESCVDVVVLGCTHFPLILERLTPLLPSHINWLDSSTAVAKRVEYILTQSSNLPLNQSAEILEINYPVTTKAMFTQSLEEGPLMSFLRHLGVSELFDYSRFSS